jgi:8-oxo-dGTP pyrophosphatase MutT (NUDIX family)
MNELESELRAIGECGEPGYPFAPRPDIPQTAAVLALFHGEVWGQSEILLIKRSQTVATHAGQVAFPGGGSEASDEGDFLRTALRETWEEVGVDREGVRLLGPLPPLPTVTGSFSVVPVLGILDSRFREVPLKLDPREVEHAAWAKIGLLERTRREQVREVRGHTLALPEFDWEGERMWGLTALIFDLILRRYDRIRSC